EEDVVIVGAGVAGLATALGLHRQGIRSLVLESSDQLRITGFGLGMWKNAWKAMEALGIATTLRQQHHSIQHMSFISVDTGAQVYSIHDLAKIGGNDYELRSVNRKLLLETMANELPEGTIRFSSKVVGIQNDAHFKYLLLLAGGTRLKTKVLIGSDGVNSIVAKLLGFKKPVSTGRYAVRGAIHYDDKHELGTTFIHLLGKGVRFGIVPSNDHFIYWFFTYIPSSQGTILLIHIKKDMEHDHAKLKQFLLEKLANAPEKQRRVFADTELGNMYCTELKYRHPWDLLWGNIYRGNACVIGDALHPMTPDVGQGACIALEDAVVLARCIGEAMKTRGYDEGRLRNGLKRFAGERRWRSITLISLSYFSGVVNQGRGSVMSFLRDKFLAGLIMLATFRLSTYDSGKL
ncbi:hypothetical protein M569_05491, partial [Genlisea aurea]